jgi:UDPglucose--hexose-1-phosphate uridylyltransferase
VVHSPDHVRCFADLGELQITSIAEAWQHRIDTAAADGFAYVHALINEGRLAGSSLPHSHSQLVVLREVPPPVVAEDRSALDELVERDDLRVLEQNGAVAVIHAFGASPYESLILGGPLADLLNALRDLTGRVREAEGPFAWNAWLHATDPGHIHFVPRLTALAGVELGAGLYVNPVPPEQAAEKLRG